MVSPYRVPWQGSHFKALTFPPTTLCPSSGHGGDHGKPSNFITFATSGCGFSTTPVIVPFTSWAGSLITDRQIYDWLILFESETKRVWFWERGWGLGSALYVISRYGLFFDMPINIICESSFVCVFRLT